MDVTKILAIVFGILGLCSGGAIFLNGARKDGLISVLTEENNSLIRQKNEAYNDNARLTAERDGYKRQYEDVKELAQGSPQLKILTAEFHKFNITNNLILQTLQNSEVTLARNTRSAKRAAKQVKKDLEETND